MVLPLTTAVTQVVMLRTGDLAVGVPANIVEVVRRVPGRTGSSVPHRHLRAGG